MKFGDRYLTAEERVEQERQEKQRLAGLFAISFSSRRYANAGGVPIARH